MPIRFRCQHCHQFMGIARRKSGTEVQCPTCRHNVLVPRENEVAAEAAPRPRAAPGEPAPAVAKLFEHSNFDEVLRGGEGPPRIARPAPKNGGSVPRPSAREMESVAPVGMPAPTGIFLSSNRATLLAVAGIVLLAIAFGAGLFVGRYCL